MILQDSSNQKIGIQEVSGHERVAEVSTDCALPSVFKSRYYVILSFYVKKPAVRKPILEACL